MAKSSQGQPQTEPDDVDRWLLDLATGLLADYFFDPDNEALYRQLFPSRRTPARGAPRLVEPSTPELPLTEQTLHHADKTLNWRLDILGQRNGFRLSMEHPAFTAQVEGIWQFQHETLRRGQVVQRTGHSRRIVEAAEGLVQELGVCALSQEQRDDLLAALAEVPETPMIGDNSDEPPPATDAERDHTRLLLGRMARKPAAEPAMEDRAWLEITPQVLPVLADLLVEAMVAPARDERRVSACLDLLALQLEFVRYRLDRGWDWAARMLNDYQQRLITLGRAGTLEPSDWFAMAAALSQARVPISDDVQQALADAGLSGAAATVPPEEMLAALRGLSDELADMVGSPFEVLEAFSAAAAVMPGTLRSFMATELALSSHAVLREAVPLMLLDGDTAVRRAAAAAMEQTAGADTVSPDWLRRAITLRNWIPHADRAALDRAIRKARTAGVPIGAWPASPGGGGADALGEFAFHASMVDGSGAQSILAVSRAGRKGLVAGLLLKHGVGVQDAWLDTSMSRSNSNAMLRDMKSESPCGEVARSYVDTAVQHAIATGLACGTVPTETVLAIAEGIGAAEWKDRRLDVVAEAHRLFDELTAEQTQVSSIEAALGRGVIWMQQQPIAASWLEDTPGVRRVIARLPRRDTVGATRLVLNEVLPATRMAWAERFLLMALWCQSATTKAHRDWAADFVVLTHAVASNTPLESIPIMTGIAAQTVMAARTSGW